MGYIAVSLLTISLTTFVVYKIANNVFNMQLKPRPIILCACCALFISLVLPRVVVGYAGVFGTLVFLALFAIVFAYYIAYYDSSNELSAAAPEGPTGLINGVNSGIERRQAQQNEATVAQKAEGLKISSPFHIDDVKISENDEGASVFAIEGDVLNGLFDARYQSDEHESTIVSQVEPEKWEITDDMDELLDYAFNEKERQNYNSALNAFRKVLRLYPDSDAIPYVIVEIGNILKTKGAYDEAIKVFSEGRNHPGIDKNLETEFINTVAFLRIVKNTLLKHRLGFIPFNQIPPSVYSEIDLEFREWRNLA